MISSFSPITFGPASLTRVCEESDCFDEVVSNRGLTVGGFRVGRRGKRARRRPSCREAHQGDKEEVGGEGRPHVAGSLASVTAATFASKAATRSALPRAFAPGWTKPAIASGRDSPSTSPAPSRRNRAGRAG